MIHRVMGFYISTVRQVTGFTVEQGIMVLTADMGWMPDLCDWNDDNGNVGSLMNGIRTCTS